MITVVSSTNRPGSKTKIISDILVQLFSKHTESQLLDLQLVNPSIMHNEMYEKNGLAKSFYDIQDQYLVNVNHFVFVIPEYNGSYPGILKLFIDAISMRSFSETFHHKKAGLIGISAGRAGNIRGMDHFSSLLNYLKVTTYPNKLPISSIAQHIDEKGNISSDINQVLNDYVTDYLIWIK